MIHPKFNYPSYLHHIPIISPSTLPCLLKSPYLGEISSFPQKKTTEKLALRPRSHGSVAKGHGVSPPATTQATTKKQHFFNGNIMHTL